MAPLIIRQNRKRTTPAEEVAKRAQKSRKKSRPSDEDFSKIKGKVTNDNKPLPNNIDLIKKVANDNQQGDGSVEGAIKMATANAPKTKEEAQKPTGGENYLNINGIKPKQNKEEVNQGKETSQEQVRKQARTNIGLQEDETNGEEPEKDQENEQQDKVENVKNKINSTFKKYGQISYNDAEKILNNKIEGTSTWQSWLLDISLEFLVLFFSLTGSLLLTILNLSGIGTAPGIILSIISAIIMFFLNGIIRTIIGLKRIQRSRKAFTNIENISGLQKILKTHSKRKNILGVILEWIPIVSILPVSQVAGYLDHKFRKKVLKTIKEAKS